MNSSKLLSLVLVLLLVGAQLHAEETMLLSGTCRNVTHGVDGHLKLMLTPTHYDLAGWMSISGVLGGSGVVKGERIVDKVTFKTKDPLSGFDITWKGDFVGSRLHGEYYVAPSAGNGYEAQKGEWDVTVVAKDVTGENPSEKTTLELLKFVTELKMNAPVKQADGTLVLGAESLFNAVHPVGNGVSIQVEEVDVDWKPGSTRRRLEDIHKFRTTYVLHWQGVIRPTGWTRLKLAYNNELNAVTSNEIIASTGTTNAEVSDMAFGVGFLLGQAAMESMLK